MAKKSTGASKVTKPKATRATGKAKAELRAEAKEAVKEHVAQATLKMPEPRDLEHHFKTIKGFKEKASTANSHLRDARKKAKEAGINLAALDGIYAFERMDEHEVRAELSQLAKHMELQGHPVQIALFEAKNGNVDEEAYRVGRRHCELGRAADNPYPEGSTPAVQYERGYMELTAERLGVTKDELAAAADEGEGEKLWPDDVDVDVDDVFPPAQAEAPAAESIHH